MENQLLLLLFFFYCLSWKKGIVLELCWDKEERHSDKNKIKSFF
jgi:hypothetical protein